jgi:hypothetical protein
MGEKPSIRAGSAAKRVTLGSLCPCAGAWTATCSMTAPVTPSTRPEAERAESISTTADWSNQPVPVAAPSAPGMSSTAPFAATVSSVEPSALTAVERIVWLIVSPVVSAAAMIVVPSMSPTTISALRPRRRPTLRSASFTRIRLRSARAPSAASATPSPTRRTTRSVSTGMPKTSFIGYAIETPARSANATS